VETNIILVIDHVIPVAKGGLNDPANLVSSCDECNSGKSDKVLSDSDVLKRTLAEVEKLQEICGVKKSELSIPGYSRVYYCAAIVRNRFNRFGTDYKLIALLKNALREGVPISEIEETCKTIRSYYEIEKNIEALIIGADSEVAV
jgi:uncharacterized CHY-type Zn-finger protein